MSHSLLDPAWAEAEAQVIINEVLAHFGNPRLHELVTTRLKRAQIRGVQAGLVVAQAALASLKTGAAPPRVDLASILGELDA